MTIRLGVLISGGGTTLKNLDARIRAGELDARIAQVISSSAKAGGFDWARSTGLTADVVRRRRFDDDRAFSSAIDDLLFASNVELVVLGGFLKRYLPPERYRDRCVNIHPSLIPAFSGKGFYGARVHREVWRRGCKVSGCTVHFVNDDYDEGPIIAQRAVDIRDCDSPEAIQAKVCAEERRLLPEVIQWFAEGRVSLENGRAHISLPNA